MEKASNHLWPRVMRWHSVRVQRSVDRGCAGLAIELRESGDIIHILIISCPRGGVAMFQFEPPLKKIGLTENPASRRLSAHQ